MDTASNIQSNLAKLGEKPYEEAHLITATVRVLEHLRGAPPTAADVCQMLRLPVDAIQLVCRRLTEAGILAVTEGAYGERLSIGDHLAIENLPRRKAPDGLGSEIERFKKNREGLPDKIAAFQAKQAQRQKDLFAKLEKDLKKKPD